MKKVLKVAVLTAVLAILPVSAFCQERYTVALSGTSYDNVSEELTLTVRFNNPAEGSPVEIISIGCWALKDPIKLRSDDDKPLYEIQEKNETESLFFIEPGQGKSIDVVSKFSKESLEEASGIELWIHTNMDFHRITIDVKELL